MPRHRTARLIIVDDHDSVRAGITLMLTGESDFEIVGEASDGSDVIQLCRNLRPDLVLMDVRMPKVDGLTATRALKQQFPEIGVLILTMHENQDYLMEALLAGAAGYVLKDAPLEGMAQAVRRVLEGDTALDERLSHKLLTRLVNERETGDAPATYRQLNEAQPLTPRELQVLELMAMGLTNRDIAGHFTIAVGTVKNHVEHIIAKLAVSDRTQAVVRGLETGIISFPKF